MGLPPFPALKRNDLRSSFPYQLRSNLPMGRSCGMVAIYFLMHLDIVDAGVERVINNNMIWTDHVTTTSNINWTLVKKAVSSFISILPSLHNSPQVIED